MQIDTQVLSIHHVRTKPFGERCFSCCAPKQWNWLPSDIRHIQSSHAFKTALKTHLYKQYHNKWFHILSSYTPSPNPPTPPPPPRYIPSVPASVCVCERERERDRDRERQRGESGGERGGERDRGERERPLVSRKPRFLFDKKKKKKKKCAIAHTVMIDFQKHQSFIALNQSSLLSQTPIYYMEEKWKREKNNTRGRRRKTTKAFFHSSVNSSTNEFLVSTYPRGLALEWYE